MKPGAGQDRRNVGSFLDVRRDWELLTCAERGEFLRVRLIYPAEAPELTLDPVEVTVMVRVTRGEAAAANSVIGFDALNHVDREGDPGDPGGPIEFVGQVELGRSRVVDVGFSAKIVYRS